jgi:phosphoribosylformimino-5-aminoimidazole carboxamide ribotide isomerase
MEIWPAIDLLGGKCVRLEQGDYNRETVFSDQPAEMAKYWFAQGAEFLHCVDLDGAKSGSIVNEQAIRGIVQAANGRIVQLGGGVREESTIARLLGLGLSRLVVGTAALKDPDWFAEMCRKYPKQLVLGVDARGGLVATEGWLETSKTPASELISRVADKTDLCAAVVYTDIEKDGMMAGPNFKSLLEIQSSSPFPVIASGGVSSLDDLRKLAQQNSHGAIVGRALYDHAFSLPDALAIGRHFA